MSKTLLLGLHDPILLRRYTNTAIRLEYQVDVVSTFDAMITKAKERQYYAYVMNANLGNRGSIIVTPSVRMYELVKDRTEQGLAIFLALSANPKTVEQAKAQSVPAQELTSTFRLEDFF